MTRITWYACAPSGGLWNSWDEGQTWEVFGVDVLAPLGVTDLWIDPDDPDHLWLATGDGNGGDTYSIGVLETNDGGASWAPLELSFEIEQGRTIYAIRPHPSTSDTVFVGTDLGLFRTVNGGITFDLVRPGAAQGCGVDQRQHFGGGHPKPRGVPQHRFWRHLGGQ